MPSFASLAGYGRRMKSRRCWKAHMALINIALLDLFARTAVAAWAQRSRPLHLVPLHQEVPPDSRNTRCEATRPCGRTVPRLRRGRGHRREKRRDRDAGHEDVFDA